MDIHLNPTPRDDEVDHMPLFGTRMHPGGLAFILLHAHGVRHYNSERRTSRSTPLELYFPISHLPMTKRYLSFSLPILVLKNSSSLSARGMPLSKLARWLLKASLFSSGFDIVGTYTLIIVACSEVVSSSRFCHLLAVAFVSAL